MTQRHRRQQGGFDLQPSEQSPNGTALEGGAGSAAIAGSGTASPGPNGSGSLSVTDGSRTGRIEVSPRAIAHIASRATQQSYGVVGLAPRHGRPGWVELLHRDEAHKGVEVTFPDGRVLIELYVVIEYGTRISEVARNIMSNVKFAVESALGVSVVQVNVNVQDIRVSDGSRGQTAGG